jgi:hypothetical protein
LELAKARESKEMNMNTFKKILIASFFATIASAHADTQYFVNKVLRVSQYTTANNVEVSGQLYGGPAILFSINTGDPVNDACIQQIRSLMWNEPIMQRLGGPTQNTATVAITGVLNGNRFTTINHCLVQITGQ